MRLLHEECGVLLRIAQRGRSICGLRYPKLGTGTIEGAGGKDQPFAAPPLVRYRKSPYVRRGGPSLTRSTNTAVASPISLGACVPFSNGVSFRQNASSTGKSRSIIISLI